MAVQPIAERWLPALEEQRGRKDGKEIAHVPKGRGLLTAAEIKALELPEVDWIVENLIPPGLAGLGGAAKIGKSWFLLQLGTIAAAGGEFLGYKVRERKVLYFALEDGWRRLKDRIEAQNLPDPGKNLCIGGRYEWIDAVGGSLNDEGVELLLDHIRKGGFTLVMIDTFSRAVAIDQLAEQEVKQLLDPLQMFAINEGVAIVFADHHAKNRTGTADPVRDFFGSVSKGAVFDTALGVYREENSLALRAIGRDIEYRDLVVSQERGLWSLADSVSRLPELQRTIIDFLRSCPMGAPEGDIVEGTMEIQSSVHRALKSLLAKGWVETSGDGRGASWRSAK